MRRTSRVVSVVACAWALLSGPAHADSLTKGAPDDLFAIENVVSGLEQPTSFAFLPDGRLLVTQKTGDALLVDKDGKSKVIGTFPVAMGSELGLLHVILHPDFETNRLLIFYYSLSTAAGGTDPDRNRAVTVRLDETDQLDMTTEHVLVRGLRGVLNHDGGALGIGPDRKLYIGVGDSGCDSRQPAEPPYTPTNFFATCLTMGSGKILRVDLDGSIPKDNPLVGKMVTSCGAYCRDDVTTLPLAPAREDIWAWGFRNPWRFWFDPKTGNLWVGDVGENTNEEIDVIPPTGGGKHYGWPWREGGQGHPKDACRVITPDAGDCVDPQYFCNHATTPTGGIDPLCRSITAGLIVDSCQFPPSYRGRYFFGDSTKNWIATLTPTPDRSGVVPASREFFLQATGKVVHLDTGPDGALYYATIGTSGDSMINRVVPKQPAPCPVSIADAGPDGARDAARDAAPDGTTTGGSGGSTGAVLDAGSTGGGRGEPPDASATADSGRDAGKTRATPPTASRQDAGCGCRVPRRRPSGRAEGALLALLLLGRRAMKRPRSRRAAQR